MSKRKNYIITFHRAHNYGAFLQSFALCSFLNENNFETYILDYRNNNIENGYKLLNIRTKNPKILFKRIHKLIKHYNALKKRKNKFNELITSKLSLTTSVKKIDDIKKIVNKNDNIIVGSDQVWNINITRGFDKFYYLKGDIECKKISYAASVGDNNLIINNTDAYKTFLSNFDCISVREKETSKVLSNLLNKEVTTVLDPTLLLTKEQWDNKIDETFESDDEYIFSYYVSQDKEFVNIVNSMTFDKKLPVISCGLEDEKIFDNYKKSIYSSNPFDFINYIKNAKYVVTTSFHATVFSIIYHKDFYVIPHRKTGTRIVDLLSELGLNDRIYDNISEYKNRSSKEINWKKVDEKLNSLREESIKWIIDSIMGGEE